MPLDRAQLQVLELALEDRRRALEAELRRDAERVRKESFREIAGPVTDLGDEALADLIADLDNADLTRDLNELRAIDAALARMANGKSYGRCPDCGLEIPFARLKAEPAALRCVECQGVHERTHTGTPRRTL
jgi:phage/conjugal plasmid C-4 type zinc finger TraR family protein